MMKKVNVNIRIAIFFFVFISFSYYNNTKYFPYFGRHQSGASSANSVISPKVIEKILTTVSSVKSVAPAIIFASGIHQATTNAVTQARTFPFKGYATDIFKMITDKRKLSVVDMIASIRVLNIKVTVLEDVSHLMVINQHGRSKDRCIANVGIGGYKDL